jgi:hypothetical protein
MANTGLLHIDKYLPNTGLLHIDKYMPNTGLLHVDKYMANTGLLHVDKYVPNTGLLHIDAPENPEKYQMKAHFLLSSVVYNIVPFYVKTYYKLQYILDVCYCHHMVCD